MKFSRRNIVSESAGLKLLVELACYGFRRENSNSSPRLPPFSLMDRWMIMSRARRVLTMKRRRFMRARNSFWWKILAREAVRTGAYLAPLMCALASNGPLRSREPLPSPDSPRFPFSAPSDRLSLGTFVTATLSLITSLVPLSFDKEPSNLQNLTSFVPEMVRVEVVRIRCCSQKLSSCFAMEQATRKSP